MATRLGGPRRRHAQRTAAFAAALAPRFGLHADAAYRAGLLHDLDKEVPEPELLARVRRWGLTGALVDPPWPAILHGPVAACELVDQGLDPEEAAAVAEHSTGRVGMGLLSMLVYVADKLEPGRAYEGVEQMRRCVGTDLRDAMRMVLVDQVAYMTRRHIPVHPAGLATRDWLMMKGEDGAER